MTIEVKNAPTPRKMADLSWMEQASCHEVDTEGWFDDAPPKAVRRHIRAVCSHCPVGRSCLSYALVNNESSGAWGGFAIVELQPLKQRLAAGEALSSVLNAGIQDRDSGRSSDAA